MSAQSLIAQGYGGYAGWGDAAADADFKATGGAGKKTGGGSTSSGNSQYDSLMNPITSSLSSLFNQVPSYEQANPFSFDEQLATQAATAEYSPYYDQMLTDYTTGVERTKSRSQEDLTNTLTQLAAGKEYYMGTERRLLDRTLDATNKGYAGQGLFFSGAKQKDINQINTEYGAQTGEYNRQYGANVQQAQLANTRTGQDITTAQSQYSRDIGQAKKTGIAQGVLQRQSEAIQQYEMGRTAYYDANQYSKSA